MTPMVVASNYLTTTKHLPMLIHRSMTMKRLKIVASAVVCAVVPEIVKMHYFCCSGELRENDFLGVSTSCLKVNREKGRVWWLNHHQIVKANR